MNVLVTISSEVNYPVKSFRLNVFLRVRKTFKPVSYYPIDETEADKEVRSVQKGLEISYTPSPSVFWCQLKSGRTKLTGTLRSVPGISIPHRRPLGPRCVCCYCNHLQLTQCHLKMGEFQTTDMLNRCGKAPVCVSGSCEFGDGYVKGTFVLPCLP